MKKADEKRDDDISQYITSLSDQNRVLHRQEIIRYTVFRLGMTGGLHELCPETRNFRT